MEEDLAVGEEGVGDDVHVVIHLRLELVLHVAARELRSVTGEVVDVAASGIGGGAGGTGEEDASTRSAPTNTKRRGLGQPTFIDLRGTAEAASDA